MCMACAWCVCTHAGKHGSGLGKTTGWIHRTTLKHRGVEMLGGLDYLKVRYPTFPTSRARPSALSPHRIA